MSDVEKLRQEILGVLDRFENEGKVDLARSLARRLVDILGLSDVEPDLKAAIASVLGRDLTADESFKISKLQLVLDSSGIGESLIDPPPVNEPVYPKPQDVR